MSDHQTATPERLAKVKGRVDRRQRDLRVARSYDRIVPIFELMARRSQITVEERAAGERFAAFLHGARAQPGLVSAYGDQRWSGTTAGQSLLTKEEWPMYCAQEVARAKSAIGDPVAASLLERIIEADATLQDIGHAFIGCRSPQQAMAAGVAVAKITLARLASHYGVRSRGAP